MLTVDSQQKFQENPCYSHLSSHNFFDSDFSYLIHYIPALVLKNKDYKVFNVKKFPIQIGQLLLPLRQ